MRMSKQRKLFEEEKKQIDEQPVIMVGKLSLLDAGNIAEIIINHVYSYCERIDVVGSIRRCKPEVHDIDFVVLTKSGLGDWRSIKEQMINTLDAKFVMGKDAVQRFLLQLGDGKWVQIDFYRADSSNYGILKLVRTGSEEHNIYLAKLAIKQGLRLLHSKGLCEGSMVLAGGLVVTSRDESEDEVFRFLNLKWIEPQLREIGVDGKPIWEWKKYWREERITR